ncbi:MAG: pilus assembly protein, partial [Anaerolineales bacterium]|nr:pilus assembly protein [Anaerolineales bacterium]
MVHRERTFRQRERGQSLVETALLLPILLLIIAGLVEISNLIIAQSKTDTAARIGARFGANGGEPDGIRIAALNSL